AWFEFSGIMLYEPSLEPRHRELMILRVAWLTRQKYEWVQHWRAARKLLSREELEAIVTGPDAPIWTDPIDRALLRATDQMLDHYRIDDDTWADLTAHFDEKQTFELTFVISSYACLS